MKRLKLLSLIAVFTALFAGCEDHTKFICLKTLEGHSEEVNSVAYSPDGTKIISSSEGSTINIWDANTGECLKNLKRFSDFPDITKIFSGSRDEIGHSGEVNSVAFSPDGTKIISGSTDKTIKIWDANTGHCLKTLEGHSSFVESVAFSPDGTKIISGSFDETVKIWDANTGECLKTLKGHSDYVESVAYSPDGTKIISGSWDGTIKIWDANTGECLKTLEGHTDNVESVAYSPDGTKIISGSQDRTIKIWDASTGECLKTLEGHVNSVAYSPDGTKIISGGSERISGKYIRKHIKRKDKDFGAIKIWDANTGECLKTLEGHSKDVSSVAFSPDGTKIISGSEDHTIKIWGEE